MITIESLLFWMLVFIIFAIIGALMQGEDSDEQKAKNSSSNNSDSESNQSQIRQNLNDYPYYSD